jgi:hypothetical protein
VEKRKEMIQMPELAFTVEQHLPAGELRRISQEKLLELIKQRHQIGLMFNNNLEAVVLPADLFVKVVNRIKELEEKMEQLEVATLYNERKGPNESPEEWFEAPEGVSALELYRKYQKTQKERK